MPRRRCPLCGHTALPVLNRCPAPTGDTSICGCTCNISPDPRPPRGALTAREVHNSPALTAILAAIWEGHTYAWAIAQHTTVPERTVYDHLARFETAGWMTSTLEPSKRSSSRRTFTLTPLGRTELGWAQQAA